MNTNHNRIKVADLETNQPDKILTTNSTGELEFSNLNNIKIGSYNGLDYTIEGKALDARQGKELKNLIDTKTNSKIDKAFGPSQANKLLGTDANGDLKLYSMVTYPAPFWGGVVSTLLPNSTSNLIIKGAFFTPSITASIAGQTINYITFINDNEIHINVTTGSVEGSFSLTLSNGNSVTYNNAVLIVWGNVHIPNTTDMKIVSGFADISKNGQVSLQTPNVYGEVQFFNIPANQNFRIYFLLSRSPLGAKGITWDGGGLFLYESDMPRYGFNYYLNDMNTSNPMYVKDTLNGGVLGWSGTYLLGYTTLDKDVPFYVERIGTQVKFKNTITGEVYVSSSPSTEPLNVRTRTKYFDITDIKYIELA